VRASAISFTIGANCLALVVALFYRSGGHRAGAAASWAWTGGAFGDVFVTSSVVVPVRVGAAAFFGIGSRPDSSRACLQTSTAGSPFEQEDVTPLRALGVALLIGGALLVRLF
jgi:transporter family-2 protein